MTDQKQDSASKTLIHLNEPNLFLNKKIEEKIENLLEYGSQLS